MPSRTPTHSGLNLPLGKADCAGEPARTTCTSRSTSSRVSSSNWLSHTTVNGHGSFSGTRRLNCGELIFRECQATDRWVVCSRWTTAQASHSHTASGSEAGKIRMHRCRERGESNGGMRNSPSVNRDRQRESSLPVNRLRRRDQSASHRIAIQCPTFPNAAPEGRTEHFERAPPTGIRRRRSQRCRIGSPRGLSVVSVEQRHRLICLLHACSGVHIDLHRRACNRIEQPPPWPAPGRLVDEERINPQLADIGLFQGRRRVLIVSRLVNVPRFEVDDLIAPPQIRLPLQLPPASDDLFLPKCLCRAVSPALNSWRRSEVRRSNLERFQHEVVSSPGRTRPESTVEGMAARLLFEATDFMPPEFLQAGRPFRPAKLRQPLQHAVIRCAEPRLRVAEHISPDARRLR